jgi:iron complex transport system ATP-binding protein
MTVKISVRSASFSYGEKRVWHDLNLEIESGETICLLGSNGCGKTTLLNCIHGDLRLEHGTIRIDGRDIRALGVRDIAKRIGYVFQEHSAPFPYRVIDVVRMGRTPHLGLFQSPSRADTMIANEVIASLGIGHLAQKRYTRISGGERQLVLIARTLCQEPEIILLDEPTSHLDFGNQAMVLKTIRHLAQQGLTIIMTTHFPNHAWLFSSRVALMNEGELISFGPAVETISPENLSRTYGIGVKIYTVKDTSGDVRFCMPDYGGDRS